MINNYKHFLPIFKFVIMDFMNVWIYVLWDLDKWMIIWRQKVIFYSWKGNVQNTLSIYISYDEIFGIYKNKM